nr:RNA-binding protein 25-like isoform X1 [Coffea arabica]
MAEPLSSTSAETTTPPPPPAPESNSLQSESVSPNTQLDSSVPKQSSILPPNPNPNPNQTTPPPPPQTSLIAPPSIQPGAVVPPTAPSFRPATTPLPQFSPIPLNPGYQAPVGVPPPGVSALPQLPGMLPPPPPSVTGAGQVPVASSVPPVIPPLSYAPQGQPIRAPYAPLPNGYPAIPQSAPQGVIPPPGILRYPSPFAPMARPAYPTRPLAAGGVLPPLPRPPIAGPRAPIIPAVVRPAVVPSVASTEKQTTLYVGKIASTVENDFILSLLELCGPVKSWRRPQNPTDGTFKGFGFCEFESAEGVLRAIRLLSKLNIDGQELMLNYNQATRDYLDDFVRKKRESLKNVNETETESSTESTKRGGVLSADKQKDASKPSLESSKSATGDSEKDDNNTKNDENRDASSFGLVTDDDRKGDQEALEKLTGLIEERLKNRPLPPPPPQIAADGSSSSNLEGSARSKDGEMDADTTKADAVEDKYENEMPGESKPSGEQDRSETSSPDRERRHDRRSRDRDRELKREKEKELERYEREREQERAKREKEREYRIRDDERRFKAREKEWEAREKEREHWRKREREREKNRAQERRSEIANQERERDDGYSKKKKYRDSEEERRRRQREKEEDMGDRLKEEEEVAEAKRMAEEERKKKEQEEELRLLSGNGRDGTVLPEENNCGSKDKAIEQTSDHDLGVNNVLGDGTVQNGIADLSLMASLSTNDARQNSNAPSRKLGFGLQGSGKRTTVPSVFDQDEDEDMHKEKKMRPLVPIDYSTEEQLAIHSLVSEAPPSNLAVATESVRRISNNNSKDEKPDLEKEKGRRSHDRSSQRDRDRNGDDFTRTREESRKESLDRDRVREPGLDKVKAPDNQKLLDAKQLIDMIPKTKDELFSYGINWATYDKNALHERMKPWISKKITEFLGEEEPSLVEYIMSSTREHVEATEMLNRLQAILDEEAEMFVLKMWRMLIFEIKRVETGLALRSRT